MVILTTLNRVIQAVRCTDLSEGTWLKQGQVRGTEEQRYGGVY
jgi:hypothetical protein